MPTGYTDTPHNLAELEPYIITEKDEIIREIIGRNKCYFYDTCSFRRHANLNDNEIALLLKYLKQQNGVVVITRCILMELASHSGMLNQEYITYIARIQDFGIPVLILYEENLYDVMGLCFSTNQAVNQHLCHAVRAMKRPVSTITETLAHDAGINSEVIQGKNLDSSKVYQRFFKAVRAHKESGDNLGEELIAICLYLLSRLPGEPDGKFCVITDDKEAAGKINDLFEKTAKYKTGKKIGIFSTPKLVQILYREGMLQDKEQIKTMLCHGTSGNIVILGLTDYALRNEVLSYTPDELVDLLMQPNGIHISF